MPRIWHPWRGLEGLPREIWLLSIATLVNRAGSMVLPFLVLFLTSERGLTARQAGMTLALYGVGSLIAAPIAGRMSDRFGAVALLRGSFVLSGIVLLVYPLARGWGAIIAATLVLSILTESFRPANLALLSELTTPDQRKQAYALNRLALNLGMSVGPAVGGWLASVSFTSIFWVDGGTTLAAAGLLLVWPIQVRRRGARTEPGAPAAPGTSLWRDGRLLLFLVSIFPVAVVFFQHVSAMPLYMVRNLGLAPWVYGLMFTLNTLIIVALEVPLNTAMAHWHHGRAMALGAILTGLGFGALGLAWDAWTVAVTTIIWTFGEMILFPAMPAYVSQIAPEGRTGASMGLFTMTFGLAFVVGPWLGTELLERAGGAWLWGIMLVLGLVSAWVMRRLR